MLGAVLWPVSLVCADMCVDRCAPPCVQYSGVNMADAHDVVVVAINYRLGGVGFLALPELQAETVRGRVVSAPRGGRGRGRCRHLTGVREFAPPAAQQHNRKHGDA